MSAAVVVLLPAADTKTQNFALPFPVLLLDSKQTKNNGSKVFVCWFKIKNYTRYVKLDVNTISVLPLYVFVIVNTTTYT